MPSNIYNKYKIVLPAQGRMAMEGVGKLIGSLVGCSGNQLPTDGGNGNELYPAGKKVCYTLNGAKYKLTLLEPLMEGQMSVRAEDDNGKFTMANAEWISDITPDCREAFPIQEEEYEEDDDY